MFVFPRLARIRAVARRQAMTGPGIVGSGLIALLLLGLVTPDQNGSPAPLTGETLPAVKLPEPEVGSQRVRADSLRNVPDGRAGAPQLTGHTATTMTMQQNPLSLVAFPTEANGRVPGYDVTSAQFGKSFYSNSNGVSAGVSVAVENGAGDPKHHTAGSTGEQSFGGTGTAADPAWMAYSGAQLNPTVEGLTIDQRTSVVLGTAYSRNDVTLHNATDRDIAVQPAFYADCYFAGSDTGTNSIDNGRVDCIGVDPKTTARISLVSASQGATFSGGHYAKVQADTQGKWGPLSNQCWYASGSPAPTPCETTAVNDNGFAVSWQRVVPAQSSVTVTFLTSYADDAGRSTFTAGAEADRQAAIVGDEARFTLFLENSGPDAEPDASVGFLLPDGLRFVEASGQGSYDPITGVWDVGSIGIGERHSVEIRVVAERKGQYAPQISAVASQNLNDAPCSPSEPARCGPPAEVRVAGVRDDAATKLSAAPSTVPADGLQAATVTVQLLDSEGDTFPQSGADLTLSASLGELSEIEDQGAGRYTALLRSRTLGTSTVSATLDGAGVPATAEVVFRIGDPVAAQSKLELSTGTRIADGVAAHTATVTLRDAEGRGVSGRADDIALVGNDDSGLMIGDVSETEVPGVYEASVRSRVAGTPQLSATTALWEGEGFLPQEIAGSGASVTFLAGAADAAASSLVVTPKGPLVAAGRDEYQATVQVRDRFGNPVQNEPVLVRVSGGATPENTAMMSDRSGRVVVSISSTRSGEMTVAGLLFADSGSADSGSGDHVLGDHVSGSPGTVQFVPGAPNTGDTGQSQLTVTAGTRIADGVSEHRATAQVLDAHGNPVAGAEVHFSAQEPAQVSAERVRTDATGVAESTIVTERAGTVSVGATVNGEALAGSPASVEFVSGPAVAANSTLVITPDGPVVADGDSSYSAQVTLRDRFGNPVSDTEVRLEVDPRVLRVPGPYLSGADGTISIELASQTAETFPGAVFLEQDRIGEEHELRFVAGSPSIGLDGGSRVTVSPGDRLADGVDQHRVLAQVVDRFGNPVYGVTVRFTASGAAQIETSLVQTRPDGTAESLITSRASGTFSVTSSIGGEAIAGSPGLASFVPGPPDLGENGTSTLTVTDGTRFADGEATHLVTAVIRDAQGNPVVGAAVRFTGDQHTIPSSASVITDEQGRAEFATASTAAGHRTVSATVTGFAVGGGDVSASFIAGAASAEHSEWRVLPTSSIVADGISSFLAIATVRDTHANPVAGATVSLRAPEPAQGTVVLRSGPDGTVRTLFRSTRAGTFPATADLVTAETEQRIGSPVPLRFHAGDPEPKQSTITASPGRIEANGIHRSLITVTIRDAHGNLVVDAVPESLSTTLGTLEPAPAESTPGRHAAWLTSAVAGTAMVSFSVAGTPAGNAAQVVLVPTPLAPIPQPSAGVRVTGTAEPGVVVTVRSESGDVLGTARASADGTFTVVLIPAAEHEDTVLLHAHNADGFLSPARELVIDAEAPPAPVPNPVVDLSDGQTVTGTAEPGSTVVVRDEDGQEVGRGVTDEHGNFTVPLDTIQPEGSRITVTAEDAAGNTSAEAVLFIGALGLELDEASRYPGERQTAHGNGFQPGEDIVLTVDGGMALDVPGLSGGEDGTVRHAFAVADQAPAGELLVTLTGERSGAVSATFAVLQTDDPSGGVTPSPSTPAGPTPGPSPSDPRNGATIPENSPEQDPLARSGGAGNWAAAGVGLLAVLSGAGMILWARRNRTRR